MRDSEQLRIVAIVQARMGSTRLPGKVLKPVAGQPLLWHIVSRLKHSHLIEDIAIATTTNPADEAIVEWGAANGVTVVRGPEDNVLARFALAAEALDADIIVRVSSDAPFIDAGFVDHMLASMIEQSADYVLVDGACAHEGVDPLSRRALDKLMMDASNDPVAREHVTGYFKQHPDFVRIAQAAPYPSLAQKPGRLTIDTPDDLAFIEAVHARMNARAGEAALADILMLLEREPQLRDINAHVQQKPISTRGGLALIRCDGGGRFGYGHIKRMVALARALRDREGIGSIFAVRGTVDAHAPIKSAGFRVVGIENENALVAIIADHAPDLFLLDCREGPSRAEVATLSRGIPVTAVIDDGSDRRLAADFAYYPPVPQAYALDWHSSKCSPRIGWEWSLLGLTPLAIATKPASRPTLLVSMGGSDPFGLTLRMAQALSKLEPIFRARFVIGPGMADRARIASQIAALKFETIEGADDLATEYASADLALCAFGVTAYELASFGVPALYVCLDEDQARSASAFEHAGIGMSLGVKDTVTDKAIADWVWQLLNDTPRRRAMHKAGLMTMDGNGAARIAGDLSAQLAAVRDALKLTIAI